MGMIYTRSPRTRQPSNQVALDTANPLAYGLGAAFETIGGSLRDVMAPSVAPNTSVASFNTNQAGYALSGNGSNYVRYPASARYGSAATHTIALYFVRTGALTQYRRVLENGGLRTDINGWDIEADASNGLLFVGWNGGALVGAQPPVASNVGEPTLYVWTTKGTNSSCYVNGVLANQVTLGGTPNATSGQFSILRIISDEHSPMTGIDVMSARIWPNRVLLQPEIAKLSSNYWQLFAPLPRRIWVPTVQLLRPESDITTGAWTPSTGTTLYGVIDESTPDDNDYMLTTTSSTAEIKFAPGSTPSAGNIVIRYRAKNNGTGSLTAYLYQGATLKATHNPTLTNTFQTFTWTLTSGEASSITDFTDLRVRFTSS